ncbi:hypothetical protein [Pseudoalteromonas ardens]|uniref:GRAM domain-containing protein n=1 Tax=Pseudoalteromonas rubra TaxID=43658 RepID=A0A0L0EPX8_9GAMM|nr:hypothetical protein [Pseudoalteromonas sp. R96]KNC66532.1 hypothetical protein AC626_16380 [Pseudoalteromonas rubra]MDK1312056.1 hypothetical protein [Pseudoalteromonas sp. R96]
MNKTSTSVSIATIQNGVARSDGKLSATKDALIFEPLNKKFGLGPYHIERSAISKIERCYGTGAGILPVTTEAIRVTLINDHSYEFIIANAKEWLAHLNP